MTHLHFKGKGGGGRCFPLGEGKRGGRAYAAGESCRLKPQLHYAPSELGKGVLQQSTDPWGREKGGGSVYSGRQRGKYETRS